MSEMRKVKFTADWRSSWSQEYEIEIPADTPRDEVDGLIGKYLETANVDTFDADENAECEDYCIDTDLEDFKEADVSWQEPADDEWGPLCGRLAWTDGTCVIFKDGPRPSLLSNDRYTR